MNSNKNRPLTEEHKQSISEASIGKPGTNTGKIFDENWRFNMSEAHKGKTFSEEHKQNLSDSHKDQVPVNKKLTFEEAEKIREEYAAGGISQAKLAVKYGISQPCIFGIIKRKTYTK
jgi:DNA-binding transcriptional regulator YiaG